MIFRPSSRKLIRYTDLLDRRYFRWPYKLPTYQGKPAQVVRELISLSHYMGRLDPKGTRPYFDPAAVVAGSEPNPNWAEVAQLARRRVDP